MLQCFIRFFDSIGQTTKKVNPVKVPFIDIATMPTKNIGQRGGSAINVKGQKRVKDILNAACNVLIEDGYSQFSLRNIARSAGIHLSNLQYYFAGKNELIHGLVYFIGEEY